MTFDRTFGLSHLRTFWQQESGAVTVDWVVLTAAVVGLALSVWVIVVDSLFTDSGVAIAVDITEATRRN